MGHRRGISRALEKRGIPFYIWSNKKVVNKTKAIKVILAEFPKSKKELYEHFPKNESITHIIAGSEEAVLSASLVRTWLKARRNPHSVIIKCTDKLKMKEYLRPFGIPMTEFVAGAVVAAPEEVIAQLGTPLILKPRQSSGGRGIERITDQEGLKNKINRDILFEKAIVGREGSVESFVSDGKIEFTNITEYRKLGHCNLVPSHYSPEVQNHILDLNQKVLTALNIQWGMTHLEFYITPEKILFGEIALRPPGGYIMEALQLAYGANFWELFTEIELGLSHQWNGKLKNFCASMVFHPASGEVTSILGSDKIKKRSSVEVFKLKIKAGDIIDPRKGVGQDVGYALIKASSPEELIKEIEWVENQLHFKIKSI